MYRDTPVTKRLHTSSTTAARTLCYGGSQALFAVPAAECASVRFDAIRSVLRASGRDSSTAQRDAAALPSRVAANLARLMPRSRNDGVRRRAGMLLLALAEAHSSRFTPHLVAAGVHGREQLSELLSAGSTEAAR